jgi:hypothetical protein
MSVAKILGIVVAAALLSSCTAGRGDDSSPAETPPRGSPQPGVTAASSDSAGDVAIRITFGSTTLTGRLNNTSTGRALAERLPLTLPFRDLMSQEKTSPLTPPLPTDGVPKGADPVPGDIGYWVPDGDLVLYYGDVPYWDGIVRIGSFEGDRDALRQQPDGFRVTIERAG